VTSAAAIKLWSDGSEWREAYLDLKDAGSFEFETGFNVCSDPDCKSGPLQTGAIASQTFTFNDWTGKGLPERTCEELGNCPTPAPPDPDDPTLHPASIIAVIAVLLIGLVVLAVILALKAKKGKESSEPEHDSDIELVPIP